MRDSSKLRWVQYLSAMLVGAVCGIVLSLAASWRAGLEGEAGDFGLADGMRIGLPAVGGAAAAAVLVLTTEFRDRGRWEHYASWSLAGILGVLCILVPDAISARTLGPAFWAVPMGIALGLGLGLFVRQLAGHRW